MRKGYSIPNKKNEIEYSNSIKEDAGTAKGVAGTDYKMYPEDKGTAIERRYQAEAYYTGKYDEV